MGQRHISGTRTIDTTPEQVFDLLADPAKHPAIDGSGSVRSARTSSPRRLELGSTFGMDMKMGPSYKIQNKVVEFEENRLIAWRHFNGHRWRWELTPVGDEQTGDRTQVTETFDWSTAKWPWLIGISRFPQKNKDGIERSLDRLAEMFAG